MYMYLPYLRLSVHDIMANEKMGFPLALLLSFSPSILAACRLPLFDFRLSIFPFVSPFAFRLSLPLSLALGLKARRREGARNNVAASLLHYSLLHCFTAHCFTASLLHCFPIQQRGWASGSVAAPRQSGARIRARSATYLVPYRSSYPAFAFP